MIRIDLDQLITAREHRGDEMRSFIDLQTGEIVMWFDAEYCGEIEGAPDLEDLEDNERYLEVESFESSISFSIMEGFVETLPEGRIRGEFVDALERSKPFRNFRRLLDDHLDIRDDWFKFQGSEQIYWCKWWVGKQNMEAEFYDSWHR